MWHTPILAQIRWWRESFPQGGAGISARRGLPPPGMRCRVRGGTLPGRRLFGGLGLGGLGFAGLGLAGLGLGGLEFAGPGLGGLGLAGLGLGGA